MPLNLTFLTDYFRCDRVWVLAQIFRRRTSVVPEIRIMAPSLERGLDEVPPHKHQTTFIEPEPRMKRERYKKSHVDHFTKDQVAKWIALLGFANFKLIIAEFSWIYCSTL